MSTRKQSDRKKRLTRVVEEEGERELMDSLDLGAISPFPTEEIMQDVSEAISRIAVRRREYDNDRAMIWIERTAQGTTRWLLATLEAIAVYGQMETPCLSGVRRKSAYQANERLEDTFLLDGRADPGDWIPVSLLCKENHGYVLTLRLNGNELRHWPVVKLSVNGRKKRFFKQYQEDREEGKFLEIRCDTTDEGLTLRNDLVCRIGMAGSEEMFVALYNDLFTTSGNDQRQRLGRLGLPNLEDKKVFSGG